MPTSEMCRMKLSVIKKNRGVGVWMSWLMTRPGKVARCQVVRLLDIIQKSTGNSFKNTTRLQLKGRNVRNVVDSRQLWKHILNQTSLFRFSELLAANESLFQTKVYYWLDYLAVHLKACAKFNYFVCFFILHSFVFLRISTKRLSNSSVSNTRTPLFSPMVQSETADEVVCGRSYQTQSTKERKKSVKNKPVIQE